MSADKSWDEAIVRIREILADDKNYKNSALKLGGIWDVCDRIGVYTRYSGGIFVTWPPTSDEPKP